MQGNEFSVAAGRDVTPGTLRKSLEFLCDVYKKEGAVGLMFQQFGKSEGKGLPVMINKIVVPLKYDPNETEREVTRLVRTMTEPPRNTADSIVGVRANWFFVEYTEGTKHLKDVFHSVKLSDFKGFSKHIIYFDMDLKDNVSEEVYSFMTPDEKREFVVQHKSQYENLVGTDPVYILFTGNGFHVGYYSRDLMFGSKKWSACQSVYKELYEKYLSKLRKLTSWRFDPKCGSVNRIDRVPYTYNVKSEKVEDIAFSEMLYTNYDAGYDFALSFGEAVVTPEINRMVVEDAAKARSMYSVLPHLRDSNPYVYKFLMDKISFSKVFNYFGVVGELNVPEEDLEFKGFKTCYSPFRRNIMGITVNNEEQLPSFRFDESTKKFWDFGKVPNTDNSSGDVVGLAYALHMFRDSEGTWPDRVFPADAIKLAMEIMTGATVEQVQAGLTQFVRNDRGEVIADFNSVARVLLNIMTSKYEMVFNKVQKQFFFKDRGIKQDEFKAFPWECPEFGGKEKATSARLLLNLAGVSDPKGPVLSTAKQIVDVITDPNSVKITENGLGSYYEIDSVRDVVFPVIDVDNPVVRFKDGIFYHFKTGDTTDFYDGYAYSINIDYESVHQNPQGELFETLLTTLIGPKDAPERMVFNYMLSQMWFSAHGDSRALVIKGYGKNGKSTLAEVLSEVLPKGITYNCNIETLAGGSTSETASRIDFLGKHLIIVSDVSDHRLDLKLKSIITGDEAGVTAKLLFKNPIKFKNTASFLLMTNSFPKIIDDVSAFLRRFLLIESKARVVKPIPNMAKKILEYEQPYIWRCILQAVEYFRGEYNFMFPEDADWAKKVRVPMKRQLINQLPTGELTLCLAPSPGKVVNIRHLYEYHTEYSELIGSRRMSLKGFSEKIASIIENDADIYGEHWKDYFDEVGMDEYFIVVRRNGQAEYIINSDFSKPIVGGTVAEHLVQGLDEVLTLKSSVGDLVLQSTKHPYETSSEIMIKLKAWKDSKGKAVEDGSLMQMKNKPLPFTPTSKSSDSNKEDKTETLSGTESAPYL